MRMAPSDGGSISSARDAACSSPVSLSVCSHPVCSGSIMILTRCGVHVASSHASSSKLLHVYSAAPVEFLVYVSCSVLLPSRLRKGGSGLFLISVRIFLSSELLQLSLCFLPHESQCWRI